MKKLLYSVDCCMSNIRFRYFLLKSKDAVIPFVKIRHLYHLHTTFLWNFTNSLFVRFSIYVASISNFPIKIHNDFSEYLTLYGSTKTRKIETFSGLICFILRARDFYLKKSLNTSATNINKIKLINNNF